MIAVNVESTSDDENIIILEVEPTTTIEVLKSRIEFQTGFAPSSQAIMFDGVELADGQRTMEHYQVTQDSMLGMGLKRTQTRPTPGPSTAAPRQQGQSSAAQRGPPGVPDPEMVRLQALGNPGVLAQLRQFNAELASAVNDPARFRTLWDNAMKPQRDLEAEKNREIARLNADPFDVEAQRRIEELIREERVQEELDNAREFYPESFGTVHMLYIPVEVNGHTIKAFVDSGAQRTVMSPQCAEECGVMRLLDKRFAGTAVGVGTAKILGRVHSAQIKIGSLFLPCSFMVMEGKSIDLLLGLDMLKRYQANIDLMKGALVLQGTEVQFLGEGDIPKQQQENEQELLEGAKKASLAATKAVPPASTEPQSGSPSSSQAGPSGVRSETTPIQPPPGQQQKHQPSSSTTGPASFPLADITALTNLGASREEAIHLLEIAGGNVEQAAGLLLG